VTTAATALTSILYSGQWTMCSGQQYLRARFYDPASGTFNRLDPYAGNLADPQSLHKYLYAHGNPVAFGDPSGQFIDFANHVLHLGFAVAGIYGSAANFQLAAQEFGESISLLNSGNLEGFILFASGIGHTLLGVLGAAGAGSALANFNAFPGALRLVGGGAVPLAAGAVTALEYGAAASAAAAILWMAMADPNRGNRPQHGTQGHDRTSRDTVYDWANDPATVETRFNQDLVDANGNRVPGVRPDAQRIRKLPDGRRVVDVVEVQSPSQTAKFMDDKIQKIKDLLGPDAGDVYWISPY